MSSFPAGTYTEQAARFDKILDDKIAGIRARQDSGEISVRQAADLRVEALSHHLDALKALRAEHFGSLGQPPAQPPRPSAAGDAAG